jgi:PPM family protein phosphatase
VRIRQAVAGTHAGAVRQFNEDAVLRLGRVPLYAIADGMGGPGSGDIAAQIALDVLKRHAMSIRERNLALAGSRSVENRRALSKAFDAIFNRMNRQIREEGARRGTATMGASLVLATVVDDYAYVAHIGDARAYLLRGGNLQRLTEDHTLAELKLRRGKITRAEYEHHPERHVLYQSLGAPFELDVDVSEVRLEHDDILLLCSDGVVGALTDEAIGADLDPVDLNTSLRGLLRSCIQARCADNVSAVLLGIEDDGASRAWSAEDPPTTPGEPPVEPEPVAVDVRGALFAALSPDERAIVGRYLEEREVSAGQRVVAEGDPGHAAHVIVSGRVLLTLAGVPLGEISDGVVGAIGFERDLLVRIQAVAKAPTLTLVLTRERYRALLEVHPALAARLAAALSDAQTVWIDRLASRLESVFRAVRGD